MAGALNVRHGAKMRIDDAKADVGDAKLTQKPPFVVAVDVGELLFEQRPLPIDEPQNFKKKGVLVLEVLIGRSTGRAAGRRHPPQRKIRRPVHGDFLHARGDEPIPQKVSRKALLHKIPSFSAF